MAFDPPTQNVTFAFDLPTQNVTFAFDLPTQNVTFVYDAKLFKAGGSTNILVRFLSG